MKQVFEIQGALDGLNEYTRACRSHWSKGGKMKKANEQIVVMNIRAAKLKPMSGKVAVTITWIEGILPGRERFRPRDRDNIAFAKKFIMDALVSEGILKNDDWNSVISYTDVFRVNRSNPRIIIEIEEV
ncbi:MAG: RusA family crossover junction endodeoxyribonuclease [Clostridia bacterium]|nr:RusA family crossover junction endodeoxyribonuclease [Clostridia bacterium]